MCKARFRCILYFLFFVISTVSVAQRPGTEGEEFGMEQMDEGEEDSETKEVESKIGLWNMSGFGAFQDSTKLDTLHDYFHIFHPVYKHTITATYVGNYGTPALDNNFFNRNYSTNYFFLQSREAYLLTPSKLDFYNTTTPYTRFDYSQSENKSKNNETRFNVVHSRNITPYWNFTFRTNQEKSDGQFNAQESKNNFVTLYTSYNKDNFNIYGGVLSSSIQNGENGGITTDSLLSEGSDPEFWATNLISSQSKFGNTHYFLNGEYRIGKWIKNEDEAETFIPVMGILYSFNYDRNKHEFYEDEKGDNDFFKNGYYEPDYTKDSIRFNLLRNVIQLKQYENADKKYSFGKRVYLGHELSRGSMPGEMEENPYQMEYPTMIVGPKPTGWSPDSVIFRKDIKYSNLYVGGGIFRQTGRFWKWNFEGKFYLTGRNAGQTELSGLVYKPISIFGDSLSSINFTGAIENLAPDYFQDKFYSNHYRWNQNLDMEQRMTIGGVFQLPKHHLMVGAKYSIINNYIYNDTLGIPNQTGDEILVMSAYVDKDFNYRNLHFRTRVLWQKSSNKEYIHIPDLSAFISAYYQFTISKVLFTQIGSDVRYNSKYYANAYAPSTGLFYLQNDKKYGNYPYIDVYASVRLKRTRVFFKWQNIGTHFLDRVYMTTPHYPMNRSTFRLGVSWAFYD